MIRIIKVVVLMLLSVSCNSQIKDTVCQKEKEKLDSVINQEISLLGLSNHYWVYYNAPLWGNGYKLNVLDLGTMMEYRLNTFKSKKLKKKKISKSKIEKIRLEEGNQGNRCDVEFMEDGAEGCLKRIKDNKVVFSYYYLGGALLEIKRIILMLQW
jgi:hypothetical protein